MMYAVMLVMPWISSLQQNSWVGRLLFSLIFGRSLHYLFSVLIFASTDQSILVSIDSTDDVVTKSIRLLLDLIAPGEEYNIYTLLSKQSSYILRQPAVLPSNWNVHLTTGFESRPGWGFLSVPEMRVCACAGQFDVCMMRLNDDRWSAEHIMQLKLLKRR